MAAYRADIEIGVKGQERLNRLQDQISKLANQITRVNDQSIFDPVSPSAVQSIRNYSNALAVAAENLREVALGTPEAANAVRQYVTALGESNAAQRLQNNLITDEIELRRKQKLAASGIRETTQYGGPIGPGPASPVGSLVGQKSPVAERLRRTIQGKNDELELQQALLRLEEKSAGELNKKVQSQEALVQGTREVLNLLKQQEDRNKFLAGKSGTSVQGPLPPLTAPGATGFAVAVPMTKAEKLSLELNAKKQQILDRMVSTRQQLSGLAENLQRLDVNSAVAIADAGRAQQALNDAKEQSVKLSERDLNISRQSALLAGKFSPIGGAENIPGSPAFVRARQKRRQEQVANVTLGAGFPLLFGGGPGAVLGGAAGGLVGGPGAFAAQIGLSALGQQLDQFAASAAKTGAALNPATADVDTLLQALGTTGTKTAEYVAQLKEVEQQDEALAVVTEELARLVGTDGVRSLRDFGQAATELSNEWAKAITQIQAALAGFLEGPLRAVVNQLERANLFRQAQQSADPRIQELLAQRNRPGFLGGSGDRSINEIDQEIVTLQAEINRKAQERATVEQTTVSTLAQQKRVLDVQLQLAQTDGDLTNDKVFRLSQILIDKEFEVKLQQAINDKTNVELIQLERKVKLQELARQRQQAQEAAAQKAARAAEQAADQQLRILNNIRSLQISLVQQTLQSGDVDLARTRAVDGEIAAIQESISQQEARLNLEARILQIQLDKELSAKNITQQETILYRQIYKEQLANLEAQYQTKVRTQQLDLARLKTARQILFAEQPRALEDIRQQRGAQVAGVQAELAFPFGGDKFDVFNQQLDQINRRYETLIPLQRQLQDLETERSNVAASASKQELQDLNERISGKIAQIELETQYLNQLDATEKALLRQQQVYAKYGFIADEVSRAFSDSISGIITGTTTVAEAFGRMFENIGKAFIDLATQILAQQLFIQVVSALLPGGFGATDSRGFSFGSLVDAFADGGYVTGPTNAIIGEGGEPEYVIPASKMAGAMARYASGLRGGGVIDGAVSDNRNFLDSLTTGINGSSADMSEQDAATAGAAATRASLRETERFRENQMQIMNQQTERERRFERERIEQMASTPGNLNIRYESQVINNVEYVTRDQAERLASQSALRGRELAINALQTSVKTRKRVGMA